MWKTQCGKKPRDRKWYHTLPLITNKINGYNQNPLQTILAVIQTPNNPKTSLKSGKITIRVKLGQNTNYPLTMHKTTIQPLNMQVGQTETPCQNLTKNGARMAFDRIAEKSRVAPFSSPQFLIFVRECVLIAIHYAAALILVFIVFHFFFSFN